MAITFRMPLQNLMMAVQGQPGREALGIFPGQFKNPGGIKIDDQWLSKRIFFLPCPRKSPE